jgi:hypothetical protein
MTHPLDRLGVDSPWRAVLFVASEGGAPRGWPFIMKVMGDRLWCTSYRTGAKMPWIEAADEACCLLFVEEDTPEPYAVVEGIVSVVEPTPDLVEQWLGAPYRPGKARVADRLVGGTRVFITVTPGREPLIVGSWPAANPA